jgi:hypothetical protein
MNEKSNMRISGDLQPVACVLYHQQQKSGSIEKTFI